MAGEEEHGEAQDVLLVRVPPRRGAGAEQLLLRARGRGPVAARVIRLTRDHAAGRRGRAANEALLHHAEGAERSPREEEHRQDDRGSASHGAGC
eukprot:8629256-Heterocapsa_arctica.AAC.1